MGILTRALRDISRRRIAAVLVVVALGFSMAIMISVPAGLVANQTTTERLSEDYNRIVNGMETEVNRTLTLIEFRPSPGSTVGFAHRAMHSEPEQYFNESMIPEILSIEDVMAVAPFLEKTEGTTRSTQTPMGAFNMLTPDYTIVGVSLNSSLIDNYPVLPTEVSEGRNLREGDSGVVLLSVNNTKFFAAGVGDKVKILGSDFTVVGVYEASDPRGLQRLYMSISDAQRVTGLENKLNRLDIYANDKSNVGNVVSAIAAVYPQYYASTYEQRLSQFETTRNLYQNTLQNAETTLGQMQTIAFQEIVIVIVATSSIILLTMLYTVRERTKEIGILKAIGFSNRNVMAQFMLEGISMSLMAGIVGVVLGIVGAPLLSGLLLPQLNQSPTPQQGGMGFMQNMGPVPALPQSVTVAPDSQLVLLAFGVAILLGAVGSLYPAWRASRMSPMEALRYE